MSEADKFWMCEFHIEFWMRDVHGAHPQSFDVKNLSLRHLSNVDVVDVLMQKICYIDACDAVM